jgi:RNA 2',3'-cyclic 3'-phosphodiesterase
VATRPSKARLFLALDLPEDAREELAAWRVAALGGRDDLRLVAPEALHVTLAFLGHLDEAEIPRIAELLRPSEAPVMHATAVKPVPPRQPRLFALDLEDEDGRCAAIQARLSDALVAAGLYEPEKRPFWPHVTLARVRKGARVPRLDLPDPPAAPWRGEAVTLYRSRLSREGARYEALARVDMSDDAR